MDSDALPGIRVPFLTRPPEVIVPGDCAQQRQLRAGSWPSSASALEQTPKVVRERELGAVDCAIVVVKVPDPTHCKSMIDLCG